MSIGVGTLQPKSRTMRPMIWTGGVLAAVLAVGLAVFVANSGNEPVPQTTTTTAVEVSGTAANTPTELKAAGSAYSGTLANTPSELRGGVAAGVADTPAIVPHVPKRSDETSVVGGTQGNTPTELSGGDPDFCPQCR